MSTAAVTPSTTRSQTRLTVNGPAPYSAAPGPWRTLSTWMEPARNVFVAVTVTVPPLPIVTCPGSTVDAFAPPAPGSVTSQTEPAAIPSIVSSSGRSPPSTTSPSQVARLPEASSSVHETCSRNGPAPKSGPPGPATVFSRCSAPAPKPLTMATALVEPSPSSGVSTTVDVVPAVGPVVPSAVVVVTVVLSAPLSSVSVTTQDEPAGRPFRTSEPPSARSAVIGVAGPYPVA